MTRDAKAELNGMAAAIQTAAHVLRPYAPLMHEYERERQKMESIGPIVAPSLFMNAERQEVDAILSSMIRAAMSFLAEYEKQIEASKITLAKVRR
jgi:hypothetical protein